MLSSATVWAEPGRATPASGALSGTVRTIWKSGSSTPFASQIGRVLPRPEGRTLKTVEDSMKKASHRNDHSSMSPRRWDDAPNAKGRGVDMLRASDVTPKKLAPVWNCRFYRGKLGLIAGEPGLGKSLIAVYMAATTSAGREWPGGADTARRGDVIYISAEDSAADTIRPRLEAAGADLDRVHLIESVADQLGPRPFNLVTDSVRLDQSLQRIRKPRLVIIDPINGCLRSTDACPFNSNSVPQVRALLGRLETVAVKNRVAVVGVTHFTKAKGGSALPRVTGSIAFVAAARSVFTVVRGNGDPDQRVFAPAKNNLGRDADALFSFQANLLK
jgi:putative DNA primase/helicase